MTRKKVKLAFIMDDYARKLTYKKRKKGMLKKIEELSTLCGIEACAIVYSPYDPQPEVWPSHWDVHRVLEKFMTLPELEQSKKMMNQESFLAQMILKGNEQMMKLTKDNRKKELTMFLIQCLNDGSVYPHNNMTTIDFNVLSSIIEQNLNDINKRMETLKVNEMAQNQTPALEIPKIEEMTPLNYVYGHAEYPMENQWFMDMLNGDGYETIMPPFGYADADLQFQTGYWPNLLP